MLGGVRAPTVARTAHARVGSTGPTWDVACTELVPCLVRKKRIENTMTDALYGVQYQAGSAAQRAPNENHDILSGTAISSY